VGPHQRPPTLSPSRQERHSCALRKVAHAEIRQPGIFSGPITFHSYQSAPLNEEAPTSQCDLRHGAAGLMNEIVAYHFSPSPHGGVRPVHQTSTRLTQLTLGPYVVQIWSRNPPNLEGTKLPDSTEWFEPGCVSLNPGE